ncbi:MAG: pyridoxamine 5'-phosphate oxidase family protein [Candidatus Dormibacteraeota bacterium]|nr:pyridoxamine 5'-phosphate oxidase family protein [Candidatus Dormibacteraeota bacterium]
MITRAPSPDTRVRRHPERAHYDRETVDRVLDECLVCHLGFVAGGRPFVIPTIHARSDDVVYIHGSNASRMIGSLQNGVEVCLTATIVDGVVLARSAFSSSMNYRSVCVLGRAEEVTEAAEKETAFAAIVEHIAPGRWADCRHPTPKEVGATTVMRLPLAEYSCKVRTGPPIETGDDLDLPFWAGVVPLQLDGRPPEDSPNLRPGCDRPAYLGSIGR